MQDRARKDPPENIKDKLNSQVCGLLIDPPALVA